MRAGSAIAPAAVMLVLGAWLSAEVMFPATFNEERLWPILVVAAGACFLLGYLLGGGPWQLFLGLTAVGSGTVMFGFTGGALSWSLMPRLWPLFLVVLGASELAYLVASRDAAWALSVLALGTLVAGVTGLLHGLGLMAVDPIGQLRVAWPLLLMLTGLAGLLQALWQVVSGH